MTKTRNITFASDYTTSGGRSYKADSTHAVNSPDARVLIATGKARPADDGAKTEAAAPVEATSTDAATADTTSTDAATSETTPKAAPKAGK